MSKMSREEAITCIEAIHVQMFNDGNSKWTKACDMAIEAMKEQRPHGEWIFHKYDKDYECSNCHVRFDQTQIYTEKRFENAFWAKMEIYNFCPNCGADMRPKEGEAE